MFVVLLLLLATVYHGAFGLREWAPAALLVLVTLCALQLSGGGLRVMDRWAQVMLAGIWLFAAWSLLSALWAQSPSLAWEGGARTLLYAGLLTLPIVLVPRDRLIELLGLAVIAGIAALAIYTLVRMLLGADGTFLAGRLDDPVGYRNATALLFAIAVWPLLALSARGPMRAMRAAAFALAVLCLALAFLTQSRGIIIGLGCGGVVALALGPERVRRAWLAIVAGGLLAIFAKSLLTPYDAFDGGTGIVTDSDISTAARATLILTVVAFAVGLAFALIDNGMRTDSTGMRTARGAARVGLVAVVVVGIIGGFVAVGDPIGKLSDKWDEFNANTTVAQGETRYGNVSGQRQDLWRVALDEFQEHPLEGVGQGNYQFGYYRDRHNDRNLDDPHGLPFQVLAELGIVGLGLLIAFLVGAIGVLVTRWRQVPRDRARLASGLAAGGAAMLGQSLVDWMWRIPGVTGLGVLCIGIAVALVLDPRAVRQRSLSVPLRVVTGVALAAGAVVVGTLYLSSHYLEAARDAETPAQALSDAQKAAKLNPVSVDARYLEASAHETLGQFNKARADLDKALELEPENFATMGVIGDFYARRSKFNEAKRWYARALALNPLDVGLQQLAETGGKPQPPS